jgi:hypothetical protein
MYILVCTQYKQVQASMYWVCTLTVWCWTGLCKELLWLCILGHQSSEAKQDWVCSPSCSHIGHIRCTGINTPVVQYIYRTEHPVLHWLPTILAEWMMTVDPCGIPAGCADTAAANGWRSSNIYEVNTWLWQFGRGKPRLGGLTIEETQA